MRVEGPCIHAMGKARERQLIWPWEDKRVRDLRLDLEKGEEFAMWIKRLWAPQRGKGVYCESLVCTKSGEKLHVVGSQGSWWEVMRQQVAWEDF